MKKKLKLRGRLIARKPTFEDSTKWLVEVTLVEQSHFLFKFGEGSGNYDFISSGGFRLVSMGLSVFVGGQHELFIPESKEDKYNSCIVSVRFWEMLKQAVEEYNTYEFTEEA